MLELVNKIKRTELRIVVDCLKPNNKFSHLNNNNLKI